MLTYFKVPREKAIEEMIELTKSKNLPQFENIIPKGSEEELRQRRGAPRAAGVAADVIRDAGRGDQDDEPARQRHRARHHPQDTAHPRLHYLRARRVGEGGLLQVS